MKNPITRKPHAVKKHFPFIYCRLPNGRCPPFCCGRHANNGGNGRGGDRPARTGLVAATLFGAFAQCAILPARTHGRCLVCGADFAFGRGAVAGRIRNGESTASIKIMRLKFTRPAGYPKPPIPPTSTSRPRALPPSPHSCGSPPPKAAGAGFCPTYRGRPTYPVSAL